MVYIRKREIKKNPQQSNLTSERTRIRRREESKLVEGNNKVQSENKWYRDKKKGKPEKQ